MLTVIESKDLIEIQSSLPIGQRALFLLLALFPLLAPYQLLLRPNWDDYFNLLFLLSALISLGALTLSAVLVWAAGAGLNSRLRFDRRQGTFTFSAGAPIGSWRSAQGPIGAIAQLQVDKHHWSDGPPSYSIRAITSDGRQFNAGSSGSLDEVEGIIRKVSSLLDLPIQPGGSGAA